jgi:hypothetical protein
VAASFDPLDGPNFYVGNLLTCDLGRTHRLSKHRRGAEPNFLLINHLPERRSAQKVLAAP